MISRKRMLELFAEMFQDEILIIKTKGQEYSGEEDSLRNFKELSKDLDISKEEILWVYLKKHLDAIRSYIMGEKTHSGEDLHSRIIDARVYLGILDCMNYDKDG